MTDVQMTDEQLQALQFVEWLLSQEPTEKVNWIEEGF